MTIRSSILSVLLVAVVACGGKKQQPTLPDETGDSGGISNSGGGGDSGEAMIPPETMDDIQRRFDRKRPTVSRCLSAAVDAKELPKNSRGKITLNVTVMPGGKAGEIKVVTATLDSPKLTDCVIA